MSLLLSGGLVYSKSSFKRLDISIDDGQVVSFSPFIDKSGFDSVIDCNNLFIVPGFLDVHVHLREPGFCYKETVHSGTLAAARGGYTGVCAMPNLSPAPDCLTNLSAELDAITRDAVVAVYPYGTITAGQNGERLSDMEALSDFVAGFSDDGRGVQSEEMMLAAMKKAKSLNKPIVAHCEDNSLLKKGGCVNECAYAKAHGLVGISSESEWKQLRRDLRLVEKTGVRYHACHISTKQSVGLIREAKKRGLPVTSETAPHYLALCDNDLIDDGRFKMNPPLRSALDRAALIEGITDGTIDVIATDHAPHSAEEKSRGLRESLMGITGLETAFPVLYTVLVTTGVMSFEKLIEKLSVKPRELLNIPSEITVGFRADFAIIDTNSQYKIDSSAFLSKGKSSPFDGMEVSGEIVRTIYGGRTVWDKNSQKR